ncbi:MAG: tetratricopeptide repeat protein, partial [Planctomycetales bacterium]|nr:tetratricopeptide repeat protein [Planctomycetales bacterium]
FLKHAPDALGYWEERGFAHAEMGRFDLAIAEFDKAIAANPEFAYSALYARTLLLLASGKTGEFNAACAEFIEQVHDHSTPSARSRAAWLVSVVDNPLVDKQCVLAMAHAGWEANKADTGNRHQLALGAACVRAGEFRKGQSFLEELVERLANDGDRSTVYEVACGRCLISLALLAQGKQREAEQAFHQAQEAAQTYAESSDGISWGHAATLKSLTAEVEEAISRQAVRDE